MSDNIYGLTRFPMINIFLYFSCVFLLYISFEYKNEYDISFFTMFLTCMVGLYVTDFVGAIIHYYLDNYTGNIKIIKNIADNFQIHHENPIKMTKSSMVELLNQISTAWFLPFLCFLVNTGLKYNNITHYTIQISIIIQIILFGIGSFSQTTHRVAHKMNIISKKERNTFTFRFIHMLQEYYIILNPTNHKTHHNGFDKNYSVFNGWSTSLVNKIVK